MNGFIRQKYINGTQLALRLDLKPQSVRRLRSKGEGPPWVKFRGRILYEIEAVEKWEQENLQRSEEQKQASN